MQEKTLADENGNIIVDYEVELIKGLRAQRHDFLNHIQVIWGYLQLNKPDQARDYINDINVKFDVIGRILKIDNPKLSLSIYTNARKAYKSGIAVDLEADINWLDIFDRYVNGFLLNKLDDIFNNIINKIIDNGNERKLYIDIFTEDGVLCMSLSNSIYDEFVDDDGGYEESNSCDEMNGISIYCKCDSEHIFYKIDIEPKEA